MSLEILIVESTASDIRTALEDVVIFNRDHQCLRSGDGASRIVAAILCSNGRKTLLEYGFADHREPLELLSYASWLAAHHEAGFWTVAFGWSLYWDAVMYGTIAAPNWPTLLESPVLSDPFLPFLDLSNGYVHWDFQLEMIYRLCDDDPVGAKDFKKLWNAQHPHAAIIAEALRLPNDQSLAEVLKKRGRPGAWKAVREIPIAAVANIWLKTPS